MGWVSRPKGQKGMVSCGQLSHSQVIQMDEFNLGEDGHFWKIKHLFFWSKRTLGMINRKTRFFGMLQPENRVVTCWKRDSSQMWPSCVADATVGNLPCNETWKIRDNPIENPSFSIFSQLETSVYLRDFPASHEYQRLSRHVGSGLSCETCSSSPVKRYFTIRKSISEHPRTVAFFPISPPWFAVIFSMFFFVLPFFLWCSPWVSPHISICVHRIFLIAMFISPWFAMVFSPWQAPCFSRDFPVGTVGTGLSHPLVNIHIKS